MADKPTELDAAYALEDPDSAKSLYRAWADTYDSEFAERSGYRSPARVAEIFLQHGGSGPVFDAGCGTGLIAQSLPDDLVLDGLDFSPEMLSRAQKLGCYRHLIEGDLTTTLPFETGAYGGIVSAGTLTNGHVDHRALDELVRILAPDGLAVISGHRDHLYAPGFEAAFDRLLGEGQICDLCDTIEPIYATPSDAPTGHGDDHARILWFRKT